jgi:hypothetical protein
MNDPVASSERQQVVDYIMREARERYGNRGKADVEEALERIAQLILRGEHLG